MLYRAEDSERSVAIKTTNPRLLRNTKKTRLTSVTTDEPVSQSECNLSSFWAERSQELTNYRNNFSGAKLGTKSSF